MKMRHIAAVLLLVCTQTGFAETLHGKIAGSIAQKNEATKEIIIHCADTKVPILTGSKLYLTINEQIVLLDVTFPMISSAKCRLAPRYSSFYPQVQKGTTVYFGTGPVAVRDKTAALKQGENKNIAGIDLIALEGGTFMMGGSDSDPDAQINEKPLHRVEVTSFWISKSEITQDQYQQVMGNNPSSFKGEGTLPVESISWYDAIEFCNALSKKSNIKPVYRINKTKKDPNNTNTTDQDKWIVSIDPNANGFRLPTEAEWEFACRAGTSTPFFTGENADQNYYWNEKNSRDKTHPVGKKSPSPNGLYDITGNVWEWCWDWNDDTYYRTSPEKNPMGPASGSDKILRGASWINSKSNARSSSRNWTSPSEKSSNAGLRIVVSGK